MPLPFSPPKVEETINRLNFWWEDTHLLVYADRLSSAGNAELWFYHDNGSRKKLLHTTRVNLLSTTTINQVVKRMTSHNEEIPWQQVLTLITSAVMEYQRRGEPGVILKPVSVEELIPTYLVEPLLMEGVPNVIFGEKGVNKSTIALTLLGILQVGYQDSPSGLVSPEPIKTGILDWESTEDLTNYTLARLIEGGTISYCEIPYLRCKQRLSDDIERIANFIFENQIKVVVIDSLGQAAGSDKFDSAGKGAALNFFECLRQLKVTSLIIGQNAKGDEGTKTIYGSTYYTYYSRNVFELRKGKDTSSNDELHIALFHTESNYSKKSAPLGFKLTYSSTTILIEKEEVTFAEFLDRVGDDVAIFDCLRTAGHLVNVKYIAEGIGKSESYIRMRLSRLKKKGKVVNPSTGLWGPAADV